MIIFVYDQSVIGKGDIPYLLSVNRPENPFFKISIDFDYKLILSEALLFTALILPINFNN